MSLFVIDRDKCTGDGICAAVCPVGIIKTLDKTAARSRCPAQSGSASSALDLPEGHQRCGALMIRLPVVPVPPHSARKEPPVTWR